MPDTCPTDRELEELRLSTMPELEAVFKQKHVEECSGCRERLAAKTAKAQADADEAEAYGL